MLRPSFAELLNTHDRVLRDAKQIANAEAGSISMAVVPFLAEEWLPRVLRTFVQTYPNIRIRVTDERSRQIRKMVADEAVDIGIGAFLADDPKIKFEPITSEEFGVVCRMDHPLARRTGPLPWKVLAGERLIGNDSFETMASHGLGEWLVNPVMSVSTRPSMIECVREGIGITILPALTKPEWATDLAFIPLGKPKVARLIGLMTRQGQTLLPAAASLCETIARTLHEYAAAKRATMFGADGGAANPTAKARAPTKARARSA
jgi:DNA-binding transcriptional LysR family regulator